MKGTILSIIFLMIFWSAGYAQEGTDWKWSHQKPQGNTLRWVKMWDNNNWYAVGFNGTFMKTTDAGTTWVFNHTAGVIDTVTGIGESIYDAYFWDMNNGVISGTGGMLARTTDGGTTWAGTIAASAATWYAVHFVDNNVGYASGTTSGRVAKTTDGGYTWVLNTIIVSGTYYNIWAFDANTVIVTTTAGNIRRTTDGGLTWATILTGASATLYAIEFTDANNGWIAGSTAAARFTTDGGLTWTSANTAIPTTTFYDIDFQTVSAPTFSEGFEGVTFPPAGWTSVNVLGAAVWVRSTAQANTGAASAYMTYQSSGGEDWLISPGIPIAAGNSLNFSLRKFFETNYPPDSLFIKVSTDTAFASFTNQIFALDVNSLTYGAWDSFSIDLNAFAGQTLYIAFQHKDLDGNGVYLDDVQVATQTDAIFLTGDAFAMYKSTNMGTSWSEVQFLNPAQAWTSTYYSTSFFGDNFVTVGGTGLINSVVGAGTPVAHTYYVKAGTLYDVWAESSTGKVIAVGDNGTTGVYDQLIYSNDGGQTWNIGGMTDVVSPNTVQFAAPQFEATEDNPVQLDDPRVTENIFRAVDMLNSNLGFAVGQNGSVYKTVNGGVFWDSLYTMGAFYLYDVDFIDANTGWAVGASGNCWKSTDGGVSWTQQTTTSTGTIYTIAMASATHGWLGGASGFVNNTTDGGTTWNLQTSGFGTSIVYGSDAIDVNTAYISGGSGKVAKTTDGGTTWNLLTLPSNIGTSTLYSIHFRNESFGLTGGSLGKIAMTQDGGATWQYANTAASTIYGVYVAESGLDTTAAFTVGTTGSIHKNSVFVVPVEFTSFTSSVSGNTITLNWSTATETNNSGFAVERKSAGEFETIGFVSGNGTTTIISSYSYSDKVEAGKYIYRLRQIDFDGSYSYSIEIEAEVSLPAEFSLEQNYPNPFNPATVIRYSVPVDGFVTLSVFNALGEKVATLVNQQVTAGVYDIDFNASSFASGIYFYRLDAGSFVSIKKMMLLK